MTLTAPASRMLPILIGITALSVAACGSSPTASNSSPAEPAGTTSVTAPTTSGSSPAHNGGAKDHAAGLITSVTGSTMIVSDNNINSTIGFSSATRISEMTPAALTDVTVGSCVAVRPARGSAPAPDGSLTAATVLVSAPRDGQCFTNARPAGGSPTAAPPGGHSGQHGVRGTVTSVGANTVAVTPAGGGTPTNVGISDATTYAKRAPAGAEAISQGKCVTAGGTKDGSGTLQADVIALRPADNGSCPSMRH